MSARTLATAIALGLLAFGCVYMLFVFAAAGFDIRQWDDLTRVFCAYLGAISAGASAVAWIMYSEDSK